MAANFDAQGLAVVTSTSRQPAQLGSVLAVKLHRMTSNPHNRLQCKQ